MAKVKNNYKNQSAFMQNIEALLCILVIAVVLEASLFNIRHWATRSIGPGANATNYVIDHGENITLTPEGSYKADTKDAELKISGVDKPVRTVYVRPDFGDSDIKRIDISIKHRDENKENTHPAVIVNGYEPSYYIPLGAMGNVESVTVIFRNQNVGIKEIILNKPLPWSFQWLRVFLAAFVIAIGYFWKKYNFSSIPFNPKASWQKRIDICVVLLYICTLVFVMIFSVDFGYIPNSERELEWDPPRSGYRDIYARSTDAILLGQLHLDMEPHESLINAEYPYSQTYRDENKVTAPWDHVYYNGKIYSYFGIVPVFVLFLPYYLIAGQHLSATTATVVFCSIGAIGLALFWREIAKKYLKALPYPMYLAGLMMVLLGSNLMIIAVRAINYEVALSSGFMFSAWGLLSVFRAVRDDSLDKIKPVYLFLGAACLALAVGCRPTSLFHSLLVPVMLIPVIRSCYPFNGVLSDKSSLKTILVDFFALAIPYIVIGAGLMWFNYARFGSVTEFGINYQITAENVAVVTKTGLLGNIRRAFDGLFCYLFTDFDLRPLFPYAYTGSIHTLFTGYMPRQGLIGAFAIPITWFLPSIFYIRKGEAAKKALPLIIGMVATALVIVVFTVVSIGLIMRYTVDFFWLLIIPSALCGGLLHEEFSESERVAAIFRAMYFISIAVSCVILFGWGMAGESNHIWSNNPVIIRYLSDLLMIL